MTEPDLVKVLAPQTRRRVGLIPHPVVVAVRLETLARQYLLARSAGAPRLLDVAQMDAARERYRTYGGIAPPRG